jgi:hypothetical protein
VCTRVRACVCVRALTHTTCVQAVAFCADVQTALCNAAWPADLLTIKEAAVEVRAILRACPGGGEGFVWCVIVCAQMAGDMRLFAGPRLSMGVHWCVACADVLHV